MNSQQKSPAPFRYLFARFKPFAKPKWLIPSGLIVVGGICAWQYWSHPEWLGANFLSSQPQSSNPDSGASVGSLLNDPLERLTLDIPDSDLAKPLQNKSLSLSPTPSLNPLTSPLINPPNQGNSEKNTANSSLAQLTQPLPSEGKSQLSPIFTPLIPNFKDAPVPSATDLLNSSAPSPSSGQASGSPLPIVTNNPLQETMGQIPTNSGESGIQGQPPAPERQEVSQPQTVAPTYSPPYYNYGGQTMQNTPAPYYNYGGQSVPNSPAPYYNNQPPAATSQQPYANPNYGYGSQPGTPNQPPQANPNPQQQNSPFNSPIYRPE